MNQDDATNPDKALHLSQGKVGLDQLPPELLVEWAKVFDYGAKKYAKNNWRKGTDWSEFHASLLRHEMKFWLGENIDFETKCYHLAQVMWNAGTLLYYLLHELGNDDRPDAGTYQWPVYEEES